MRFNVLLKSYGILSEADQSAGDANVVGPITQPDAAVPNPNATQPDAKGADELATDKQSELAEAEKTLVNILVDISTVLRDYLVSDKGQKPGNAEKINQLSELINNTRKDVGTSTDAIELLNGFADSFSNIFSEHFKNT